MASITKWHEYYARSFLPWDTKRPASQLVHYLSACPAHLLSHRKSDVLLLKPVADRTDTLRLELYVEATHQPQVTSGADANSSAPAGLQPSRPRPPLSGAHGIALGDSAPTPGAPCLSHGHADAEQNAQTIDHPSSIAYHVCPKCQHMKPVAHASALELACGTGASCVHMAAVLHGKVVGVDLVAEAVAEARLAASVAGVAESCGFIQADVFGLLASGDWGLQQAWSMAQQQQLQQQLQQQQHHEDQPYSKPAATDATGTGTDATGIATTDATGTATAATGAATPAGAGQSEQGAGQGFDFIYDCQAYHALRGVDEAAYVQLLHSSLRPGGLLMLLTGCSNEPAVGPAVVTEQELHAAFPDGLWEWVFLLQTRFDTTPAYQQLERLPLAWWCLLRKR